MKAARVFAQTASAVRAVRVQPARSFAGLGSFPLTEEMPTHITFPRERPGLNYDLNWSLADDNVTPRGDTFRNAGAKTLSMYISGKMDKSKAIVPALKVEEVPVYSTDEVAGAQLMDVEVFEPFADEVRDAFMRRTELFVHDGALGSNRSAELRFRMITDSPEYALMFENMTHKVPLGHPSTFPRPLTVLALSQGPVGEPCIVVDVDPETQKGTVLVNGPASYQQVLDAVASAASRMTGPAFRSQRGGGPRIQVARESGTLDTYFPDTHRLPTPEAAEAAPVVAVRATTAVKDGKSTLVVGDASAVPETQVYAQGSTMWGPLGLCRTFAGVVSPSNAGAAAPGTLVVGKGLVARGTEAPQVVAAPSRVVIVGGKGSKKGATLGAEAAVADLVGQGAVAAEAAEVLQQRLAEGKVEVVKVASAKAVVGALA